MPKPIQTVICALGWLCGYVLSQPDETLPHRSATLSAKRVGEAPDFPETGRDVTQLRSITSTGQLPPRPNDPPVGVRGNAAVAAMDPIWLAWLPGDTSQNAPPALLLNS